MNTPRGRSAIIAVLYITACLAVGWGAVRLFLDSTDGFYEAGVLVDFPCDDLWLSKNQGISSEEAAMILQKPFSYFAKGTQSYVFLSEDRNYILKIFKAKHLNMPRLLESLNWLPILGPMIEAKSERRREKREKIFGGHLLAQSELLSSGLLYCHFTRSPATENLPKLQVLDKSGTLHTFSPEAVSFLIQKRGIALTTQLQIYRNNGQFEKAQQALHEIFTYLSERNKSGLYDRDPAYAQNLGFIDGVATNLDVGNLQRREEIPQPSEIADEIRCRLYGLHNWLHLHYPELIATFDREIDSLKPNEG